MLLANNLIEAAIGSANTVAIMYLDFVGGIILAVGVVVMTTILFVMNSKE